MRARSAVVLAALCTSAACGRFAPAGEERRPDRGPDVRYGGPGALDLAATSTSTSPSTSAMTTGRGGSAPGRVEVRVVDTNGVPRPGIAVRFEGPSARVEVSGDGGTISFRTAPGRYRATAERCAEHLRVARSATAELGVAEGETAAGDLRVEVRLRFEPAAPVTYSGDANWRPGEAHRVELRLRDRCGTAAPPSPDAYARTARVVANRGVTIETPLSTSVRDDGVVELSMTCGPSAADITLALVDVLDERRSSPILTDELLESQRPPVCAPND